MKKYFILLVAALSLAACEKDFQPVAENAELNDVVQNNKVSLKQALLYAENSINGIKPTTRGAERKVKSTEIYVAKPATRSAEGTEVSFYLINYEDNQGFAMVSTDSRATPVYAYSDDGSLTAKDFETNPFLKIFIEGSVENYQIEVANNSIYDPIEWPDSSNRDILRLPIVEYNGGLYYEDLRMEEVTKPALLTTYWDQYAPYNFFCDNKVGGCAPVAAAQIMAYHKHPAQHNGHTYYWDAMTATPTLNEGIGATSAARLIADIGEEADAYYEPNGDYTEVRNMQDMKNAFEAFGYNCSNPSSYDISEIKENINAELPVYMRGSDYDANDGHGWVVDGYRSQTFTVTYYYTYAPYNLYDSYVSSSRTYLHYNTGKGPSHEEQTHNNGYYLADSYRYNGNIMIISDITPNN